MPRPLIEIGSVSGCARCGGDHHDVIARPLAIPFAPPEANGLVWTHWFPCPKNGDPVLVIQATDVADVPDLAS